jgi:hypothetical protein
LPPRLAVTVSPIAYFSQWGGDVHFGKMRSSGACGSQVFLKHTAASLKRNIEPLLGLSYKLRPDVAPYDARVASPIAFTGLLAVSAVTKPT